MWTCTKCSSDVDDQYDNCPGCGMGRDGSAPPIDFVRKEDALQPELPTASQANTQSQRKLISLIIVVTVIAVLLYIALQR